MRKKKKFQRSSLSRCLMATRKRTVMMLNLKSFTVSEKIEVELKLNNKILKSLKRRKLPRKERREHNNQRKELLV